MAGAALVLLGAAVQVAVGAGLSVVCGTFLLLALGAPLAVPVLLVLNLLVSIAATAAAPRNVRWRDVAVVSLAALAGSATAGLLPALPGAALKPVLAAVLLAVALRRPPPPRFEGAAGSSLLIGGGGFLSGLLTVWTATPGPVVPAMLSHAGRPGDAVRRTMQPISIVGYALGLAFIGPPALAAAVRWPGLPLLAAAALAGSMLGLRLRSVVSPAAVVAGVRGTAGIAALVLLAAWLAA